MGWTSMPIKYAFETTFGGIWGTDEKYDQRDRICIRVADFDYSRFKVIDNPSTIRNISDLELSSKSLRHGDILIEKSGGGEKTLVGRAVRFTGEYQAVCSNFVSVLRPRSNQSSRFWSYVLASLYSNRGTFPFIKQSTGIQNLDLQAFLSQRVNVPTLQEQEQIADELDRELAEIDAAIEDLNNLKLLSNEKLLTEIRRLIFTHDVPMAPIKRFGTVKLGKMITSREKDDMIKAPYIRAANIQPWGVLTYEYDTKEMFFTKDELQALNLIKDDVVVVEGGAGFGRSGVLKNNLYGWGYQNSINRIRVNKNIADPYYIHYTLLSMLHAGEILVATNQATIPHLTAEKLEALLIPHHSLEIQQQIVKRITDYEEKYLQLTQDVLSHMKLLKEYKTSLISAKIMRSTND
ncbi:MAG: restriction endonuclease subunit S [Rothia sp. (in: high G+C Gram-positive bacteria)]|nr:restriction endonuclease subunit S [Rothia sp. (in: high G+C Gram-positive bacteria)]